MIERRGNVSLRDIHVMSSDIGYEILKTGDSGRDVIFLEDQTDEDIKNDDPQSSSNNLVDVDLVSSPMVHRGEGGMQKDDGGNANDEASTFDISHGEVGEQTTIEPQDAP